MVAPGLNKPFSLGVLDHRQGDAVFYATSRVEIFQLADYLALRPLLALKLENSNRGVLPTRSVSCLAILAIYK